MKLQTVILKSEDLDWFKELCSDIKAYADSINAVQIGIDDEGVKFKVNYGVWTPGKGKRE